MIITKPNSEIIGSKVETSSFNIKTSAKAFQILSNSLYSNKIGAVIREYSCNALDAHRYAKCENKPFKVQLPSQLDQQFIVRDYGKGLSPEEITELFTTYFSSSKDSSNDFTGALGLGSKSAFSYTDSFSCKSYYSGVCYVYSLFLDQGEPKVTLMYQSKSDEPSGVEIIIPVNSHDCETFRKEANIVYSAFDIKPEGFTESSEKIIEILPGFHKVEWSTSAPFSSLFIAKMGNVFYPINNNQLKNYDTLRSIGENIYFLRERSTQFILDFDIGELDIAPSREQLSYDERTIATLEEKLESINISFFGYILDKPENQELLQDCKSWIEYAKTIVKIMNYYSPAKFPLNRNDYFDYNNVHDYLKSLDKKINDLTYEEWVLLSENYFNQKLYNRSSYQSFNDIPDLVYYTVGYKPGDNYSKKDSETMHNGKTTILKSKSFSERLFPYAIKSDKGIVILRNSNEWKGTKSILAKYIKEHYPNRDICIIDVFDEKIKDFSKELKSYLDKKYQNCSEFVLLEFEDILDDVIKYKKEIGVKPADKKKRHIVDGIYQLKHDFKELSDSCLDFIGFTGVEEFRRFLKKNPNARFVYFEGTSNLKVVFKGSDRRISVYSYDKFKEILKSSPELKFYFILNNFRWDKELNKDSKYWADPALVKTKPKVSINKICDVFLKLGIYPTSYSRLGFDPNVIRFCQFLETDTTLFNDVLEGISNNFSFWTDLYATLNETYNYMISEDYNYVFNNIVESGLVHEFCDNKPDYISEILEKRFNELLSKIPELKYIQDVIGSYSSNNRYDYKKFLGDYAGESEKAFYNLLNKNKDILNPKPTN